MKANLDARYDLYINGQWVPASDGKVFTAYNPATGEKLAECAEATKEDVDAAVKAAWAAFPAWRDMGIAERAGILEKIADIIDENAELLATIESMDNGKPIRETMAIDVPYSSDHFRYFAGAIRVEEGKASVLDGNMMSLILREPIGVVGQIVPWNFPFLMAAWKLAPALAAGKHLINGIDANYPPFAYVDETGKPAGFDVDSMNWIAKKMGFTVEHKPMDWDGIIPALLAKKIDMVCSGMSISPERKAQANFSDPYWTIRKIFITKKGSKVTEDQIYNGKIKLGVQRGTNEHEMLQKAQAEKKYNYQLRFYDSGPMAIEDLLNGRIDAIGLDAAPAEDAMRKGKPVQEVGVFGSDEFGVAIRKDDAETMKLVNEGYKLLKADPYWKELQAKYLGNK